MFTSLEEGRRTLWYKWYEGGRRDRSLRKFVKEEKSINVGRLRDGGGRQSRRSAEERNCKVRVDREIKLAKQVRHPHALEEAIRAIG